MNAPKSTGSARKSWLIVGITVVVLLLLAFFAGFLPMWSRAQNVEEQLVSARQENRVLELQTMLATAAIDARQGNYEPARQHISRFYSAFSSEFRNEADSAFDAQEREALAPLLQQRDELVTLLARSDPAGAERLANAYGDFRAATRKKSDAVAQGAPGQDP